MSPRYKLRTLLLLLAILPPLFAGAWMIRDYIELPLIFALGTMWIWLPVTLLVYLAATSRFSGTGCLVIAALELLAFAISMWALSIVARE